MPQTVVDAMNNAAPWQALAADGVTPSTELALVIDAAPPRPGADTVAARITASAGAQNHTLRRSFPPMNLGAFDELRLWVYGNRPADGTPARPFFFDVRLASAALPFTHPSNTWRRFVPVSQPATWEPVRLSLGDLPAAVRNAVTAMQLRCVDATTGFTCVVDEILAVREALLTDVDAALQARLDGGLVLAAVPVPAVLHPANGAVGQERPYIEITHYDLVFAPQRTQTTQSRGDYTDAGYSLRTGGQAYDLFYEITCVADDRASQAAMLEFVLGALTPRGDLVVNGYPLPMEAVTVCPDDQIGGMRTDRLPLFYRVSARRDGGQVERVTGAKTVVFDGDLRAIR